MALRGSASQFLDLMSNRLLVRAALLAIVVWGGGLDALPCRADTAAGRDAEKSVKSAQAKRKIRASSGFGVRRDPINKRHNYHKGIDVSRPAGTRVLAWSHGIVVKAGWLKGYGRVVDVIHANGVKTRYAHLKTMLVDEGQRVWAGQTLGRVGRSGRTTGANLHFEVMIDDRLVDPRDHLSDASRIVG